jgi:hypothetical protein
MPVLNNLFIRNPLNVFLVHSHIILLKFTILEESLIKIRHIGGGFSKGQNSIQTLLYASNLIAACFLPLEQKRGYLIYFVVF